MSPIPSSKTVPYVLIIFRTQDEPPHRTDLMLRNPEIRDGCVFGEGPSSSTFAIPMTQIAYMIIDGNEESK